MVGMQAMMLVFIDPVNCSGHSLVSRLISASILVCVIFLLILSYHSDSAPDVFSTSGMAYVHHLNPRISYRHIVRSTLIHMLRGE